MLILGGAATVTALTGMNTTVAGFLIPIFVIPYTYAGGLKATFMASYLHTAIIFAILLACVSTVYVVKYGPEEIYNMLDQTVSYTPTECMEMFSKDGTVATTFYESGKYSCGQASVCGNDLIKSLVDEDKLSYLTMLSSGGLRFGIINIVGNFGTVFVDQSYWQSAIAAKPAAAHKGYLLGGMVWFTIPFALATAMGLCSVALQLPVTGGEAGSGLVPPAVGTHLFGATGSWMVAIMLFMAIVSTGSAESIAVSSLVSYDIYRKYINPNASGTQVLMVGKIAIVFWGVFMGVLSMILDSIPGIGLGWVYQFMGNAIGSAVPPLWFLLTWKDCSACAAISGAIGGLALAMVGWFGVASTLCETGGRPEGYIGYDDTCAGNGKCETGFINIDTLGSLDANLCGNLLAILGSGAICIIISMIKPQNYDWAELNKGLEMVEEDMSGLDEEDYTEAELNSALSWIKKWGCGLSFVLIVVWPLASFPAGEFTLGYWTMWVIIAVIWGFLATIIIVIYPIAESFGDITKVCSACMGGGAPPTKA